jgi:DNA-binding protein HU-beta
MNRVEIEAKISEDTGISKENVHEVLQSFLDTVSDSLARSEDVKILNFGVFSTSRTKERLGRNPSDGTKIAVAAKNRVSFKVSKKIKLLVNLPRNNKTS